MMNVLAQPTLCCSCSLQSFGTSSACCGSLWLCSSGCCCTPPASFIHLRNSQQKGQAEETRIPSSCLLSGFWCVLIKQKKKVAHRDLSSTKSLKYSSLFWPAVQSRTPNPPNLAGLRPATGFSFLWASLNQTENLGVLSAWGACRINTQWLKYFSVFILCYFILERKVEM